MGDGPPRHPRSRGTRLTVLGADAGMWRELQAAVSRGEAGRAAGRRSRGLSDVGPPPRLSDFTFNFYFHALEKEMATHSSVLAWRITGTGELGGLSSMGSHRVGHD